DLGQCGVAEAFIGPRNLAAAGVAVKAAGAFVVGERPDHHGVESETAELPARGEEQARPEADPLILREEVDLVDLALLHEVARPVRAERRIAADLAADLDDQDRGAAPDRAIPPARPAARDDAGELLRRNDSVIGITPRGVVDLGDRLRVALL